MAAKSTKREFLVRAYSEPHRHYHNLAHVHDCLNYLATLRDLSARERQTLEHAIWWHDAIYEPSRSDNEERSADLAGRRWPRKASANRFATKWSGSSSSPGTIACSPMIASAR